MIQILAIIGIMGGLLCAVADCFLDLKGPDNKKLGKMGMIDSQWSEMKHYRFVTPTIYQTIMKKDDFELAQEVITKTFRQIYVPFGVLYSMLVIIPAIAVIIGIIIGIIPLPLWTILLNPVVFQIIGLLMRASKIKMFIDAPSICAASLGLAMYGVLALML